MIRTSLGTTLTDLPEEVLQSLLYFLPPDSLPAVQLSSRRLYDVANSPLLWRYHCRHGFRYWNEKHRIREKLAQRVDTVDWKELFYQRDKIDRRTSRLLDSLLSSQTGRVGRIQQIAEDGYDVKDTLLRNLHAGDEAGDVLARRYYSDVALSHLHRGLGINAWNDIRDGKSESLERALGAFDMFVLHDREGDFDEISDTLDDSAQNFKDANPEWRELSTRKRALALVDFVRRNNLTGLESDNRYRDLRNNYIGVALRLLDHPSLPLISVAIFSAIAQRIEIDARPCGFPFHVHAIVFPPSGLSLDAQSLADDAEGQPMYLDPFRSDVEVPVDHLRRQLAQLGAAEVSHSEYLSSSTVVETVLRTGRNIMNSVQESQRTAFGVEPADSSITIEASPFSSLDSENAFYSAVWAHLVLGSMPYQSLNPNGPGIAALVRRRQHFPFLLRAFQEHFPEDSNLIEEFIAPLFEGEYAHQELLETIRAVGAADRAPRTPKTRGSSASPPVVKYRVGQYFRHKRYDYNAVITGWDAKCKAPERWIAAQGVDDLSGGRQQSFYHVLVEEDKTVRYVAEENIALLDANSVDEDGVKVPPPGPAMMHMAGRHFKRWDHDTFEFVSNMRDEYPDD